MAMHCKNLYIHHFPRQSMCEVATQAAGWICCTFVKHLAYYVNKNRHSGQTNLTVKQHSLLNTSVKSLFKVTSTVSRRLVESIIQVFDLFLFLQETYSRVTFYIFFNYCTDSPAGHIHSVGTTDVRGGREPHLFWTAPSLRADQGGAT